MRLALALALIGLSTACSGCALVQDGCRNVLVGFKTPLEEHREKARNRQWAEAAWQQVCGASPGQFSEHYACGFKDGFAEYLFRGGAGEPPLVAPLHYRDTKYQNAQGYQAVQDWFAGYRHGSGIARESGARKWITGPTSLLMQMEAMAAQQAPPALERPEPILLPPPTPLPDKVSAPSGAVDIAVAPPLSVTLGLPTVEPIEPPPQSLPEPVRLRIMKITEAAESPASSNEGARIRITGVHDEPPTPASRPRIIGITTEPPKE